MVCFWFISFYFFIFLCWGSTKTFLHDMKTQSSIFSPQFELLELNLFICLIANTKTFQRFLNSFILSNAILILMSNGMFLFFVGQGLFILARMSWNLWILCLFWVLGLQVSFTTLYIEYFKPFFYKIGKYFRTLIDTLNCSRIALLQN